MNKRFDFELVGTEPFQTSNLLFLVGGSQVLCISCISVAALTCSYTFFGVFLSYMHVLVEASLLFPISPSSAMCMSNKLFVSHIPYSPIMFHFALGLQRISYRLNFVDSMDAKAE